MNIADAGSSNICWTKRSDVTEARMWRNDSRNASFLFANKLIMGLLSHGLDVASLIPKNRILDINKRTLIWPVIHTKLSKLLLFVHWSCLSWRVSISVTFSKFFHFLDLCLFERQKSVNVWNWVSLECLKQLWYWRFCRITQNMSIKRNTSEPYQMNLVIISLTRWFWSGVN